MKSVSIDGPSWAMWVLGQIYIIGPSYLPSTALGEIVEEYIMAEKTRAQERRKSKGLKEKSVSIDLTSDIVVCSYVLGFLSGSPFSFMYTRKHMHVFKLFYIY